MAPHSPVTLTTVPLSSAIERSEPLARLLERLQRSRACFDAVQRRLPPALAAQVRPGGIDEHGEWTLLAGSAAVAAKLRQWQPLLQQALAECQAPAPRLRIRVQPRAG